MAQSNASVTTGWDEVAARQWVDQMLRVEDVQFAWQLAADLTKEAHPGVGRVLDAGAGPGGFLAVVLDTFPDATGVWLDMSKTMEDEARRALERFGDRVEYRIADLVDLESAGDPGTFDLITTSRATHHLALPDLTRFYQQAANLLVTDGWVANADTMANPGTWRERLRTVRSRYREAAGTPNVPTHPQINVAPGTDDHKAALHASGFAEAEVVWKVFVTELLMARKLDPDDFRRK